MRSTFAGIGDDVAAAMEQTKAYRSTHPGTKGRFERKIYKYTGGGLDGKKLNLINWRVRNGAENETKKRCVTRY